MNVDGLGIGMKAFVAAKVGMNSNYGELSSKGGAAHTNEITTLAEYMRMHKFDTKNPDRWNIENMDDNKLMRTYVVPITLKNGQQIDLIVDANGRDLARVYIDEKGKDRFVLDENVKDDIIKYVGISGLDLRAQGKDAYRKEFIPDSLEDFAEKISDDELYPNTPEKVEKGKQNAKNRAYEEEEKEVDEENPENEGESIEEIAANAGMSLTALEKFCEKNGISDISKVKGIQKITNTVSLQENLGKDLDIPDGEEIYAVRVSGVNGKMHDTLGIMTPEGETLDFNSGHDELIHELVPEGANGNTSINTDEELEDTITIATDDGVEEDYEVKGNLNNKEYFEEKFQEIQAIMISAKEEIEADTSIPEDEKEQMIGSLDSDMQRKINELEQETGIKVEKVTDVTTTGENEGGYERTLGDGIDDHSGGIGPKHY